MFEPSQSPRLFTTPIGVDFASALLSGLENRLGDAPPEAWGRVTIFVNTSRMRRHLLDRFAAGPARLMPTIRLATDLAADLRLTGLEPVSSPLRLRLQLRQTIVRLIELQPDLAPQTAAFDLASSLAALLEEMQDEGVAPSVLRALDVGDFSAHWERSLRLISILSGEGGGAFRGQAALNRDALSALLARWAEKPPASPVIVAGSTGSRGTTRLLMEAVARLPQGAVVLPGVDTGQPSEVWQALMLSTASAAPEEDHPQYRFAALLASLGLPPESLRSWVDAAPAVPPRNSLVSLALRPAPVTDQWRRDGPAHLADLPAATRAMTLIEAPTPRHEAGAIGLALRHAVERGVTAALVTPDRTLARQVSAALARWDIIADDSAGLPLHQSPPGRFLIETAGLFGRPVELASALSLLKHPIAASTQDARGPHLLATGVFEAWARNRGTPRLTSETFEAWLAETEAGAERRYWAEWVSGLIFPPALSAEASLAERLDAHLRLAEGLASGPGQAGSGKLWEEAAGAEAAEAMEELREAAPDAGPVRNSDYLTLIRSYLSEKSVREAPVSHPLVSIWGTIEARTQQVDLCILAGLNEGTWPATLPHDPWMNRAMRREAGLLLPERRVGLAAHDFQLALGAPEVILSRSARSADAETVPSRWLNRLANLLAGLGIPGEAALEDMRSRGNALLEQAATLAHHGTRPISPLPAPRPSPAPPVAHRPSGLYVTAISTLIRDPYAIFARHILRLYRMGPRVQGPDAAMRGTVLHAVMERCLKAGFDFCGPPDATLAAFLDLASEVIAAHVPWPSTRRLWLGRLAAAAPDLIRQEAAAQQAGTPVIIEERGSVQLQDPPFRVSAKPDRIDRLNSGGCAVLDYKSGSSPPTEKQVSSFDKQLLIEAAIAEAGGFAQLGAERAQRVGYISLGNPKNSRDEALEQDGIWRPAAMLQDLAALIRSYCDPDKGYTARRAPMLLTYKGEYDHLSRYGEWDDTARPEHVAVGR